ncbi:MAG: transposase [Pyrinomonadaceae bacterium]|nr:transposase [Pyrinomonadaceae bacterium]
MAIDYRFEPKGLKSDLGWYDRGYIPHFEGGEIFQFLTFRLFDSMPQEVLNRWRVELNLEDEKEKIRFRKRVEKYLDQGYGACFLQDREVASMVQDTLLRHHSVKYELRSWAIMPNHLHTLLKPPNEFEIGDIAHAIKSFTAHEANKILGRKGQFWQPEPFDRYIRNRDHFVNTISYIENNPVKAGLCTTAKDWEFSSAGFGWSLHDDRHR